MQRVTMDIGMAFQGVEDELQEIFFPSLFQGAMGNIPGKAINGLLVKHTEIALSDPTRTVGENCKASYVITGYLVAALHRTAEFRSGYYALLMG